MTQQLSILTGCSAGATESFVVVPFELVKIKLVIILPSHYYDTNHFLFYPKAAGQKQYLCWPCRCPKVHRQEGRPIGFIRRHGGNLLEVAGTSTS